MTILFAPAALAARRTLAAGLMAPLADSLEADLARLLPGGEVHVPDDKARLTREGGRCRHDGSLLLFDPTSPRSHRCPRCGREYREEADYRWWVMGYQLWLTERAVHAAALWALRGDVRHLRLFEAIGTAYAERYLTYPNQDNVLGPTRPFFSTYLESIWLLQLCVALDLVETTGAGGSIGGILRDRLIEPSVALIASFDEGLSNRQTWNDAALAAAGALLQRPALLDAAFAGRSGLGMHLEHGLLADGTWYEGENYHLFAHRALWYLVTQAELAGAMPPPDRVRRFETGFVAPWLTALPDFTFPARRDAPYGVSLRQWRIAESCELGLARTPDEPRLVAAAAQLYRADASTGDVGRWCSTGEAERNVPGVRLTRADLGWKSLLFARERIPADQAPPPASVLLAGQGFGVLRRGNGRVYVALDYGTPGGGHGHPDRLNLWLVNGERHVLEDVGTGSYVERSLHWYRSTLAHNAPLVDGRSQRRMPGTLRAWDEHGDFGWIVADAEPAEGVLLRRAVVAAPGYLIDDLHWDAQDAVLLDLPLHVEAVMAGAVSWADVPLRGGRGTEDGFDFVDSSRRAAYAGPLHLLADGAEAWISTPDGAELWQCRAPGPPGQAARTFFLIRSRGRTGRIVSVWSWDRAVRAAAREEDALVVDTVDGIHRHNGSAGGFWTVQIQAGALRRVVTLRGASAGRTPAVPGERRRPPRDATTIPLLSGPPERIGELSTRPGAGSLRYRLGRTHYRRSEPAWAEAGAPEALVSFGATSTDLWIEVSVRKAALTFTPAIAANPLDNEHPDTNSDGVQLHVVSRALAEHPGAIGTWLLVPEPGGKHVRVTARGDAPAVDGVTASWRPTRTGYQVLARVPRALLGAPTVREFALDVIVNETAPGRERRRGQLVLSGTRDEWVYLRGDRQDPSRLLPMRIADE